MRIVQYMIVLGLLVIPLGILCRAIYFDGYFHDHGSRRKDVAEGAVVPVSVHHGTTVYLTTDQWQWYYSSTAIAVQGVVFVGAGAAGAVLNRKWKILGTRDAA